MNELDPHLADLLRRAPIAPVALDEAHRQAVTTAARQAWFRQRARSRRNLLGLAVAATLAAAIAGWTIRSLVGAPAAAAPQVVATAEPRPVEAPLRARPAAPIAASAEVPAESVASRMELAPAAAASPAPAAMLADSAPAAPAAKAVEQRRVAAAAPPPSPRGRLVMATLVADAAQAGRLPAADRQAALQAALASLAGLDLPEAEALRTRLAGLLGQ